MKITVETHVKADLGKVWDAYSNPADIKGFYPISSCNL